MGMNRRVFIPPHDNDPAFARVEFAHNAIVEQLFLYEQEPASLVKALN